MYYGLGTVDRIASRQTSGCCGSRRQAECALTTWQHFSVWNDVMAAVLRVWHRIENPTLSVDAYLLVEQSRHISSQSSLKQQSLRLFWGQSPPTRRRTTTTRWV